MWKRKDLKKAGRSALRANYWHCLLVSLVVLALVGGFSSTTGASGAASASAAVVDVRENSPDALVNQLSRAILGGDTDFWDTFAQLNHSTNGILATLFNQSSSAGSLLFGALNAINQFVFQSHVSTGVILLCGMALTVLYWLFVKAILTVGEARFYLENRRYPGSGLARLFMIYRVRRTRHTAWVMFCRLLFNLLWGLTIAGGPIKYYSYLLVPYILAENPDVTRKEAILLSRQMMAGYKWRAFLLDLSFLGWRVLSLFTLGILNILYVTPYLSATRAELYMAQRARALQQDPGRARLLCDARLASPGAPDAPRSCYPVDAFPIPEHEGRRWLAADYHRRYTLTDYIFLFFCFCFIGYVYEVIYYLISLGHFVNRGTMYGPWLPIYGVGGIAFLFLLRPLIEKPVVVFFAAMGIAGIIEYFTAWFLETFLHTKWWDYTGFFLNIQGRVCLEGLLTFAILGTLAIYVISPSLALLFDKIPKKGRLALCIALCAAFVIDFAYSSRHPNMAAGQPIDGASSSSQATSSQATPSANARQARR